MGKELIIRNEEAIALAEQLAAATGETLEEAVLRALQSMEARTGNLTREKIEAILARGQALRAKHPGVESDHSWLYDENGLPR